MEWDGCMMRCTHGRHVSRRRRREPHPKQMRPCCCVARSLTQMSKQKALSARILTHREQRARRQADPFFFALALSILLCLSCKFTRAGERKVAPKICYIHSCSAHMEKVWSVCAWFPCSLCGYLGGNAFSYDDPKPVL
jgi:hypothetical protein